MKFILLLMFFVSPAVKVPPDQRAYTLQSTTTMEFQSDTMANAENLCKFFGKEIQLNTAKTDTVTVLGWCLPASGKIVQGASGLSQWQELPKSRNFNISDFQSNNFRLVIPQEELKEGRPKEGQPKEGQPKQLQQEAPPATKSFNSFSLGAPNR